ncbi:MAG: coenzyme F420-0:L-glutamate ligase [Candidatus Methanospirareceae archaeon]
MRSRKFVPSNRLEIIGVDGLPEIKEGDDLARLFLDALEEGGLELEDGDVVVFTSKIVSKSEGRVVSLSDVRVSDEAERVARETEKDPRIVQLVLDEAKAIVRMMRNHIITETRHGFVCANAGVDESNVEEGKAVLLPKDPQKSARLLKDEIEEQSGKAISVMISDSFGRAFRHGVMGICIGIAGISALVDRRGEEDRFGKIARITKEAIADEICAAANLVMGEFKEGVPVAILRGLKLERCESDIQELLFSREEDLFR